jgi:hypothetical protein
MRSVSGAWRNKQELACRPTATRSWSPPLTFCRLLGLSVRQVNDEQKNMRRRTILTCSPPFQVSHGHVEDARKVRVAIVGNYRSSRSRVQFSVSHHEKKRPQAACPADGPGPRATNGPEIGITSGAGMRVAEPLALQSACRESTLMLSAADSLSCADRIAAVTAALPAANSPGAQTCLT